MTPPAFVLAGYLHEIPLGVPGELQVEIDGPAECCIEHVDVSLVPVGGVEELMTAAYRNIYEGITVDVVVHQ